MNHKAHDQLFRVLRYAASPATQAFLLGDREFDIKIQGQTVAANIDIFRESDGVRRILTKEFPVYPGRAIELESPAMNGLPLLNGIEIIGAPAE